MTETARPSADPQQDATPAAHLLTWLQGRVQGLAPRVRGLGLWRRRRLLSQLDAAVARGDEAAQRSLWAQILADMGLPGAWFSAQDVALDLYAGAPLWLPGAGLHTLAGQDVRGWVLHGPHGIVRLPHLPAEAWIYQLSPATRWGEDGALTQARQAGVMLRHALRAQRAVLLHAGLATLLGSILAAAASLYSMQVFDRVIPTNAQATLWALLVGVLLAVGLEFMLKHLRMRLMESAVEGVDRPISEALFARLLGVRLDQLTGSPGQLAAQLRSYDAIRSFATSAALYLMADLPMALVFLALIAWIGGPLMALVPAIALLLALLLGWVSHRKILHFAHEGLAAGNRRLGTLVEAVESAEVIKAYGAGWLLQGRWRRDNDHSLQAELAMRHVAEHASVLGSTLQQIAYILVVAIGAILVHDPDAPLTPGAIIASALLVSRAMAPVVALPNLFVQWGHARAALRALDHFLSLEQDNAHQSQPLLLNRIEGGLSVHNLRFGYPDRAQPGAPRQPFILVDTLHLQPGSKVGLIGPVGCGKSTLLRILAGVYAPQDGAVLLDGVDLGQIMRASLTERVGYLPQEPRLLSGTLRDNLLAGGIVADDDAVLDACRQTGLIELVQAHPRGLDMPLGEGGVGLSLGQRQWVGITRLLLLKPRVWLLDEPTASMDEGSERRCMQALAQAIGGNDTLILVTHKMSLLGMVGRLVVLHQGRLAMDGPRDAVLQRLRAEPPTSPPSAQALPA